MPLTLPISAGTEAIRRVLRGDVGSVLRDRFKNYRNGEIIFFMQLSMVFVSALIAVGTQTVRIGNLPTIPNGIVTEPRAIRSAPAPYTVEARQRGIEGKVTVLVEFDAGGDFQVLRVVKGLGHGLDESALAAIRQWRFAPAFRNGAPVSVVAQIDVEFNLRNHDQRMVELLKAKVAALEASLEAQKKFAEAKKRMIER
jgi:TonB family protein